MPILSGAVTFARFRTDPAKRAPSDTRRWLAKALATGAFEPLDVARAEDDRATGFVELEDPDATEFAPTSVLYGDHALFAFRVDAIRIPAAAVKAELARWVTAFQDEAGRPATRGEKAHRRDEIRHSLRQRTPPGSRVHDVSWSLATGEVQIWAASPKAVDEVALAIETAFGVKLMAVVPASLALRAGIAEDALAPTAALVGGALSGSEVTRGEA